MSGVPRWLRFAAGGLEAMVPVAAVRRTLPVPDPLPAVVELGGEVYPVADLAASAGAPVGSDPPSLLLVLEDAGVRLVLPASEVGELIAVATERIEPLPWPYDGEAPWCAGVMVPEAGGGRPVLAIDLAALAQAATAVEVAR